MNQLSIKQRIDSAYVLKNTDFYKARLMCKEALNEAYKNGSKQELNFALYKAAMLDWLDGYHKQALEKSKKCLVLSQELDDTSQIASSLSMMGLIYLYTSDYDSAIYYFKKSLIYFRENKDTTQVIKNMGFEGLVYSIQGNYLEAKKNLLKTVVLKRQHSTANWDVLNLPDDKNLSKTYYEESLINAKKNLAHINKKETLSNKNRDAYHNVALVYLKLSNADSALVYFKKAAKVATKIGEHVYWNEQSRAYQLLTLYDSAIYCNKKALEISVKYGTRISTANGFGLLGKSYFLKNEHKNSVEAYKQSMALHAKMGHVNAKMGMMLSMSDGLFELNQIKEATYYVDSSIEIARTIKSDKGLSRGLEKKIRLLKKTGNYKQAIIVKDEFERVNIRLQKGQVQLKLATLDLYSKIELNELEISDLNKEKKLATTSTENKNLIIMIILIIGLSIVLLLILNYYRTRKLLSLNKKLNDQQLIISTQNNALFESNKEKEILLGEIHHRVKNNLQTITSLLSIQKRKLKDPESIKVLDDSQNRVMAMGLIHQHLYQNSSFAEIDFKNYTKELVRVLINTNACCAIDVTCSIPALKIELDNAIYFGLIINELAINSIKHAYQGVEHPLLEIAIFEEQNKMALLVKDNGNKEKIDFNKSNSFGWKMVNNIASKLDGEIVIDNSDGLSIKILFSKELINVA